MTTSLQQAHGHKCHQDRRQQRSLAGILFDEAGPQHRSPDGRSESEDQGVIQRQQGHSEQVVANRAKAEYAANQQEAPSAHTAHPLLEHQSCLAQTRLPPPHLPCTDSFSGVTWRRSPISEAPTHKMSAHNCLIAQYDQCATCGITV